MASPLLVDQVTELSAELRRIVGWFPKDEPLAVTEGGVNTASFLFEVVVLTALLRGLKTRGWRISVVRRDGLIHLVRGPAPKRTGSYFLVSKDGTTLQVVHGTQIADVHHRMRAPDISLQREQAGDEPTVDDLLAIWDAKLRGRSHEIKQKRIHDNELRSFAMVRRWLRPPNPGSDDVLANWPPAFQVCALITNGTKTTEPASVLFDAGVSVTHHFVDEDAPTWPSRAEHIAAIVAASSSSVE